MGILYVTRDPIFVQAGIHFMLHIRCANLVCAGPAWLPEAASGHLCLSSLSPLIVTLAARADPPWGQTPSLIVALGKFCSGQQSRVASLLEASVIIA